jgi:hypothetical protein
MDLQSMLLPEKVVTFDFPGCDGLTFDLAYLSKESNQALYKKCNKTKIDTRTRQAIEEFDDDLFLQLYVKSIVKGWKGFKLKYVNELVLADTGEDPEAELEFSDENALVLMKASTVFDNWISGVIGDLGNFTSKPITKKSPALKTISKSLETA